MNHSEHYPTMIEHPRTKQRAQVNTPLQHHRQLLAWKLPGLDPVPEDPKEAEKAEQPEPGYPRIIENERTGERIQVNNKAEHDFKLEFWAAKNPKPAAKPKPATPPPPPPPAKGSAKSTATKASKGGSSSKGQAKQPPTKEDFLKQNYPESIAQRMADEEIRKFNAGEPPYDEQ